ncbi:MAG: DUF892 family protein [Vicinamibacterales bacterium]
MTGGDDVHGLIAQLRDVYDVERQLRRVIAGLSRRTSPASVKDAFEAQLTAIWREIVRLESVFEWLERGARDRRQTGVSRRDPPERATVSRMPVHVTVDTHTDRRSAHDGAERAEQEDYAGPAERRSHDAGTVSTRRKGESRLLHREPAHSKRS